MKQPFRSKQAEVAISNLMQPFQSNTYGKIHGGEIMKMMDNAAGIIAHRHCRTFIATARVDQMEFHIPISIGNLVICEGRLTYVGKHSMEVLVTVLVDDLDADRPLKVALTSYFTLVAIDKNGKPVPVPPLKVVTEEDKILYEEGKARYLAYKATRSEQ
jgi:acyl-CoA hydrolase